MHTTLVFTEFLQLVCDSQRKYPDDDARAINVSKNVHVALTPRKLREYQKAFEGVDVDKSGLLDASEFAEVLRDLGQTPSDVEVCINVLIICMYLCVCM